MIVGNVSVEKQKNLLVLSLNTYYNGVPRALLTAADAENLIRVLKDHMPKKAPSPKVIEAKPVADDDDWKDLI